MERNQPPLKQALTGSESNNPKYHDKSKLPDPSNVPEGQKETDLKAFDTDLNALVDDLLSNTPKTGKHLRNRTEHKENQTASETEDNESEQEDAHHSKAGSVPDTPVGSRTSSKDENYEEPDDVKAGKPKGSRKHNCKCKTTKTADLSSKKVSKTIKASSPAPKKQQVGRGMHTNQKAYMSTGGDLTKTQHYQEATALHNKKESRTVAKKNQRVV